MSHAVRLAVLALLLTLIPASSFAQERERKPDRKQEREHGRDENHDRREEDPDRRRDRRPAAVERIDARKRRARNLERTLERLQGELHKRR
ncbi:MAG: hypothetical protein CMJ83_18300 [Planctomycetes bacterium]|jgi:hypothetical protein|nr:hypothetical protein [Planctomycetota bacterium]